ncbi:DNA helicase II [Bradyrhizobium sp. ORS 375]|uniref:UvrD-helicase domain-containing protein n=1 Tax=Bradyrhizobium sp. (strain ORS 375) TaxID=566679 RepID=UPI00024096A2|nr:UvrD-helicase domain-containing protein [Bradyrhizobium sp. ORS 375]CCD93947.1 DNA helicase II [Bradyrhizobium sp. ORS 375]
MKTTEADEKIERCVEERKSFLLDAGAGSGKTASLIRTLNQIRGSQRRRLVANSQNVACITFTNVAKNEIIERTEGDDLFKVSTIHDFLWNSIKPFQNELKVAVELVNERLPAKSKRRKDPAELKAALAEVQGISYSDRGGNFLEGRIFHDDLLEVAQVMFKTYPMLSRLVAAKYPYIFVDEYQDTNEKVISSLLDCILVTKSPPVIGFFGDKMQSIYSDGVGELSEGYLAKLELIQKEENFRCATTVIDVLNGIRSDIKQKPAGQNPVGSAIYLNLHRANADEVVDVAKALVREKFSWQFADRDLRVLFLTHRLIARKAGYENLFAAYNQRGGFSQEQFQTGEDANGKFLCNEIDGLVTAWKSDDAGTVISLLHRNQRVVASKKDKKRVKEALDKLAALVVANASIGDVLKYVRDVDLLPLIDQLNYWLNPEVCGNIANDPESERDRTFFKALFSVPFREISAYRAVLERNLPYSTKHGVKGDEFDTVMVVLDDVGANWSQYSFGNLLAGSDLSEARLQRTRNLFYVSCSRARRNLAVVDLAAPGASISKIQKLFGKDNCVF